MTIPIEEQYALKNTRQFLRDLLQSKLTPKVPKAIRERAYQCIKHFPMDHVVDKLWAARIKEWNEDMGLKRKDKDE